MESDMKNKFAVGGGKTERKDNVRNSNIELFRIVLMLLIIAHHYTVNSGLTSLYDFSEITVNMLFLQFFGMFGKTVINCFSLITGFFMVKSEITVRKFLKTYFEVKFYYFLFYILFLATGYEIFSVKGLIKTIFSVVYEAGDLYTGTYVVFFLFIPVLNLLARKMSKKLYKYTLGILFLYFTVFATFMKHETFDFIGWMMVMYLTGAYIRLYQDEAKDYCKTGLVGTMASVMLMFISIVVIDFFGSGFGFTSYDWMMSDSNKFFALTCSVSSFLLFKNLKIKQNKIINIVAASTFGVLLIHTNSDAMRRFLWQDVFRNMEFYSDSLLIIHAFVTVLIVYTFCLIIDMIRIRFLEKPLFSWIDNSGILLQFEEKVKGLNVNE